jgi:hypothetical protein
MNIKPFVLFLLFFSLRLSNQWLERSEDEQSKVWPRTMNAFFEQRSGLARSLQYAILQNSSKDLQCKDNGWVGCKNYNNARSCKQYQQSICLIYYRI